MRSNEATRPNATVDQAFDPGVFLASASRGRGIRRYRKGDALFKQSNAADAVFYIKKGKIKITVTSAQGNEAVLALVQAGEFIGEGCLIGQTRRLATATAMTESEAVRVEKAEMLRLLQASPAFREEFTHLLLVNNGRLEEDLVDQLFNSTEKRLARVLLKLASVGKEGMPQPVALPVDQQTLAKIIGTTRSRVSHFMNKFRRLGFISYDRHRLAVHSSLLSILLHD